MTAELAPTLEQRKVVRAMAAFGVPQADIGNVVGVSDPTLRKAFRPELDQAATEANARVAEVCYRMATSGKVPAATFFWLKTCTGWREMTRLEHTGGDGGPVKLRHIEDTGPSIESLLREWRPKPGDPDDA